MDESAHDPVSRQWHIDTNELAVIDTIIIIGAKQFVDVRLHRHHIFTIAITTANEWRAEHALVQLIRPRHLAERDAFKAAEEEWSGARTPRLVWLRCDGLAIGHSSHICVCINWCPVAISHEVQSRWLAVNFRFKQASRSSIVDRNYAEEHASEALLSVRFIYPLLGMIESEFRVTWYWLYFRCHEGWPKLKWMDYEWIYIFGQSELL